MKDDTKQRSSSKPVAQQKSRKNASNIETLQRFGEIEWWRFKVRYFIEYIQSCNNNLKNLI